MKKLVVGIDISKDTLDFCILESEGVTINGRGQLQNSSKQIKKWLDGFNREQARFVMEHTGHYGMELIQSLAGAGHDFYLINPLELKRSMGIQRGKSDRVDAYRIAEYGITNRHKLTPFVLPTENLVRLRALMTARQRYVKIAVQVKNSIRANEILGRTVDVKSLLREERRQLAQVERTIASLERQMNEAIASDQAIRQTYGKITKVTGVGPIIAMKCIVETDNFTRFTDPRKFCSHGGLAPFPYQSGSSIKGRNRTHHLRDRTLKALLIRGATTAVRHDPQLKRYYNRKTGEGKHHMSVINAVANKLVLRIFAVAKRDEPFVKLAA
ncbi:hypothetical protein BST97_09640 [Nonlabens spongiae]|uniref:Uncharacterized protein n=1 Tax=Nonlabens spongiae TaxID=331648 RepID=A0A1W6MKY8_9FLAO|nr:IS110 family transposase [Nonlabens spongiae]ARN78232.1 hypothetical protein BST97_09640 [Nonlabens spongiae]